MIGLIAKPYGATIGPEVTGWQGQFPAANALNNDYGRVAKTQGSGAGWYYLDIDLGVAQQVDVLALLWTNLRSSDTVVVSGGSSQGSADVYNSGNLSAVTGTTKRDVLSLTKFMHTIGYTPSARWWRFSIYSNGGINIQISRAFVGKKAQFAIGAQKASLSAVDLNERLQTERGEERASEDQGLIRPAASLSFSYAKESEMAEVLGAYTLGLGTSKPMLICVDATAANMQDLIVFGRPQGVVTLDSEMFDVWTFQAQVTSLGI